MAVTPPKMTFSQIAKDLKTYLVITIVGLLWYVLRDRMSKADADDSTCLAEKTELREELRAERTKNDNLVNSILIKQGVIEKLTVITDSLNHKSND